MKTSHFASLLVEWKCPRASHIQPASGCVLWTSFNYWAELEEINVGWCCKRGKCVQNDYSRRRLKCAKTILSWTSFESHSKNGNEWILKKFLVANQLRISPSSGFCWWANAVGNLDCCLASASLRSSKIPFFASAYPQGHKQVCGWNNYAWHVCTKVLCTSVI